MKHLIAAVTFLTNTTTFAFFSEPLPFAPSSPRFDQRHVIARRNTLDATNLSRLFHSTEKSPIESDVALTLDSPIDENICQKFQINVCASTACTKRRRDLGMDEYATYAALYERRQESTTASTIRLEESPCLGACQRAPCVGIEHDDYEGTVGLEGMTDEELYGRLFYSVLFEEDADRVWDCVENAVRTMSEMDEDGDEDE